MKNDLSKWVKQAKYLEMTGHTTRSLQHFRHTYLTDGVHFKSIGHLNRTLFFDHAAIDKMIDESKVIL